MKYIRSALIGFLVVTGLVSVAAAADYTGPIIDAHAHLRLGETDGLLPTQPVGTNALREIDDKAGVRISALIVMARKEQMEKTRARSQLCQSIARKICVIWPGSKTIVAW